MRKNIKKILAQKIEDIFLSLDISGSPLNIIYFLKKLANPLGDWKVEIYETDVNFNLYLQLKTSVSDPEKFLGFKISEKNSKEIYQLTRQHLIKKANQLISEHHLENHMESLTLKNEALATSWWENKNITDKSIIIEHYNNLTPQHKSIFKELTSSNVITNYYWMCNNFIEVHSAIEKKKRKIFKKKIKNHDYTISNEKKDVDYIFFILCIIILIILFLGYYFGLKKYNSSSYHGAAYSQSAYAGNVPSTPNSIPTGKKIKPDGNPPPVTPLLTTIILSEEEFNNLLLLARFNQKSSIPNSCPKISQKKVMPPKTKSLAPLSRPSQSPMVIGPEESSCNSCKESIF